MSEESLPKLYYFISIIFEIYIFLNLFTLRQNKLVILLSFLLLEMGRRHSPALYSFMLHGYADYVPI